MHLLARLGNPWVTLGRGRLADLVEHLYPVDCLVCGQRVAGAVRLCGACQGELPALADARCPRCGRPDTPADSPCGACQQHPPRFTTVHAPWRYREPVAGCRLKSKAKVKG